MLKTDLYNKKKRFSGHSFTEINGKYKSNKFYLYVCIMDTRQTTLTQILIFLLRKVLTSIAN